MTPDTSASFFESMYRQDTDPWNFATSAYEQERYAATIRAIAGHRYGRAFEPGCSIGVLTASLATLCNEVVAMDISPTAVNRARERCRDLTNVHISVGSFPSEIPRGGFDLVVLSEIGYYLEEDPLLKAGGELIERLSDDGRLLAVHWLGTSKDHVLSGDRVHELLAGLGMSAPVYAERHPGFRLDLWSKSGKAHA
jgi:protein-L-isoaspartate O-methyltransferase